MSDVLVVEKREQVGSAATRRLRRCGGVPAVLYGHGEANEHLAIPAAQVKLLARHHSKTVELTGAVKDTALVSDMQWDPLGIEVLHLDLIRVNLKEKVEVSISIHVHGEAPGLREGGMLIENVHEVQVRCPAGSIPDEIGLSVGDVHVGEHKTAADLELPADVELVTPDDTVVAHIELPRSEDEEAVASDVGAEPEVIAKGGEKEDNE